MNPTEAIHRAMCEDNAALFRETLAQHPELRRRINEPLGPFDSPLVLSVRSQEMLDAFLDAGADINAKSRWWAGGFGFLDSASDELAAYALKRGARLEVHSAARLGFVDELRRMLAEDPKLVQARGGDGKTPLHFARSVEIAKLLIEKGADVNSRDIDHESTPAQHLIGEHPEVAAYLVSSGCEADIFLAAAVGDIALAERLIQAEPDCLRMRVNAEHFPMKNPRAGGTIYQWTLGFNVSPHEVAKKFGKQEMFDLLVNRSPLAVRLLVHCWTGNEVGMRGCLAENGAIVDELPAADLRQLADAARNNNSAAVDLMLKAGFPLDVRGQHRATALHWAAWHGNVEMTKLLLAPSNGRAPLEDAKNEFDCTPLGWAIHGSENGWHRDEGDYPAVVRALLDAGAKIPDRKDGTAEVRSILESRRNR